jgi:hypothetical protein
VLIQGAPDGTEKFTAGHPPTDNAASHDTGSPHESASRANRAEPGTSGRSADFPHAQRSVAAVEPHLRESAAPAAQLRSATLLLRRCGNLRRLTALSQ